MDGSFSKFIPLIFITLLCLGGVESGYLAIEQYVLKVPERIERAGQTKSDKVSGTGVKQQFVRDVEVILSRKLFGEPASENKLEAVAPEPEKNIQASELDVILMGTVNSGNDGNRAFILDKKSKKQKIYGVGDSVEGALIDKILRGKVILASDGKNEILDMSRAAEVRTTYNRINKSPVSRTVGSTKVRPNRPKRRINPQRRAVVRPRLTTRPNAQVQKIEGEEIKN